MTVNKKEVKHLGYRCLGPSITPKKIKSLQKEIGLNKEFQKAKSQLSVLAGKSRIDILFLLGKERELCVCDIADILDTTVSAASHQLKVLRKNNLVNTRRDSKTIYYSLNSFGKTSLNILFST